MLDDLPIPVNPLGVAWRAGKLGWQKRRFLGFWWRGLRLGKETLYVSCAQLIRVRWRAKYLLVPNSRWTQMQPPGGVVQLHGDGRAFLDKIRARQNAPYGSPDKDVNDLRLHVPGKNLIRFLDWYVHGESREACAAFREFSEELIDPEILPAALFDRPRLERAHTVLTGIRQSEYFKCPELLIHEFFDLVDLSQEQEAHLDQLQEAKSCGARVGPKAKFGWYTAEDIAAGGHFPGAGKQHWKIGEHAAWMI